MYGEDDLLALSGLQHIAYCERQWALIHIEGQWADSYDTVRGDLFHERVHAEGYAAARGVRAVRAMYVTNRRLGIAGIADIVEFSEKGSVSRLVRPVEYKVGKPKVDDWDRLQVCAQTLCLEEMLGLAIEEGALFYGETRRRECIKIDKALRLRAETLAARMHDLFAVGHTPRAVKGPKCRRCSLADVCLPEVFAGDINAYWSGRS